MQNLFIVESPNKIKTITKFLDSNYKVIASVGHIFTLRKTGEHGLGIDVENWVPDYKLDSSKKAVVREMKALAKKSETVFVATDPDREGEAIADNIVEALGIAKKYKRIVFNEITKDAILEALQNPRMLDEYLINAQKTRRMLDRIIGFRLSQLIQSKVKNAPIRAAAGRVQSIALKLIVDREKLIDDFQPTYYSKIFAQSSLNKDLLFIMEAQPDFSDKTWIERTKATKIFEEIDGTPRDLKVELVEQKPMVGSEVRPLVLDELFRKANSRYSISVSRVERAAQRLYEEGLISYPRTDSERYSDTFISHLAHYITNRFGEAYLQNNFTGGKKETKSKKKDKHVQDAHEAIRPTNMDLNPLDLAAMGEFEPFEVNVYKLIFEQTLKSMMKPPQMLSWRFVFALNELDHKFYTTESQEIFAGYRIADEKQIEEPTNQKLLALKVGDLVTVSQYRKEDFETEPPARYTEGSLIGMMKKINIGRPSTYGATVRNVLKRKYVEFVASQRSEKVENAKLNRLKPTEYGKVVCEKLTTNFEIIINEQYTAKVEEELDLIAKGELDFRETLHDFYQRFQAKLKTVRETMEITTLQKRHIGIKCYKCQAELIFRTNKQGADFVGCSNFPECRVAFANIDEAKLGADAKRGSETDVPCPNCQTLLVIKKNRRGQDFVACPNYPKCKTAFPDIESARNNENSSQGNATDVPCPNCQTLLVIKKNRRGQDFVACPNYPKCKTAFADLASAREGKLPNTTKARSTRGKKVQE